MNPTNKTIKAKMPRHRYGEPAPVGEKDVVPIGDTDIWGNGINNTLVQPAITVQGMRLNAAARLIEALRVKMGENYSLDDFENDVTHIKYELRQGVKPTSLGSKDGINLFVLNKGRYSKEPTFYLSKDNSIIGLLSLEKTSGEVEDIANYKVFAIRIDTKFRGQNLGVVLYLAAIHLYKSICSSENIGIMAVRTWKKISQYHNVKLITWDHDNDKFTSVPYAWSSEGIPLVDGIPIDSGKNIPRSFTFQVTT